MLLVFVGFIGTRVIERYYSHTVEQENSRRDDAPSDTAITDVVVQEQEVESAEPAQVIRETQNDPLPDNFLDGYEDVMEIGSVITDFSDSRDTLVWKNRPLMVYYSIDPSLSRLGQTYMENYRPRFGAIVLFQPRTGRVIAVNSYVNPDNPESTGKLREPIYTNGRIPAASIAKIITATAAVEVLGFSDNHILQYTGDKHTLNEYQLLEDLTAGIDISLRRAFAESINPVFGTLGMFELGANNLNKYAQNYGFNTTIPFIREVDTSHYGYPQSPREIARASSGFNYTNTLTAVHGAMIAGAVANKGTMIRPTMIDSIVDIHTGNNLYTRQGRYWRRAFMPDTYGSLNKMMEDVSRYGTAKSAFKYVRNSPRFNDFHYGGKTGTLTMDDYGMVDWFVGYLADQESVEQNIACAVLLIKPPKWRGRSSFIGAELMRRYIMDLQETSEE
jgi:cell division protein FtsI/penicillin-binding protein 2